MEDTTERTEGITAEVVLRGILDGMDEGARTGEWDWFDVSNDAQLAEESYNDNENDETELIDNEDMWVIGERIKSRRKECAAGVIQEAKTLDRLLDILDVLDMSGIAVEDAGVQISLLPTFGGESPRNIDEIYSRDESRILWGNGNSGWVIKERPSVTVWEIAVYTEDASYAVSDLRATDLAGEVEAALERGERAEAHGAGDGDTEICILYLPESGRAGIVSARGTGDAQWTDATSAEDAARRWFANDLSN